MNTRLPLLLRLVTVLILCGGFVLAWRSGLVQSPKELAKALHALSAGALAPAVFFLAFTAGLGLGLPASPFVIAGGALFGVWPGALINLLGLLSGSTVAFGVGRFLGRPIVLRWTGGTLERLDRAVSENGFQAILTMRLMPLIPFNLSNFAAGATGVSLRDYVLATLLGMLPGIGMVTWFAQSMVDGLEGEALGWRLAVLSLFLLLVSWTPRVLRRLGLLSSRIEQSLKDDG